MREIKGIVKIKDHVYLRARERINLILDTNLQGTDIYLKNQKKNLKKGGNSVSKPITLEIPDEEKVKIKYLTSFQILKRKIEQKIKNKS